MKSPTRTATQTTNWLSNSGNPLFTNAAAGDFNLLSASPLIGAGTNVGIKQDIVGNPVPGSHNNYDIGAYQYVWPNAPSAPTGVTATAGEGMATVIFTAPAANGGSTIASYTITSSPGNIAATGTSSPLTVLGLTNGTIYTFTVTATNSAGTGPASAPSNSVIPLGLAGAPTGVTATAGNAQATVSFAAPASNGGSAINVFTVTSNPGNITATGTTSPITITGLTDNNSYTFTVSATNAIGTGPASAPSNSVTPVVIYSVNSAVSSGSGSITPLSSNVASGSTVTLMIDSDTGYTLSGLTDNGTTVTATQNRPGTFTYAIYNISSNHTVLATFSQQGQGGTSASVPAMGLWGFGAAALGLCLVLKRKSRKEE